MATKDDEPSRQVQDLAMLVKKLVRALNKTQHNSDFDPGSIISDAMDYLKRKGLTGSILREADDNPAQPPDDAATPQDYEWWCPDCEMMPPLSEIETRKVAIHFHKECGTSLQGPHPTDTNLVRIKP